DRVAINRDSADVLEHDVNLAEVTAWTQDKLIFHHRPLGEVADEFNRYNIGRIEIRSPALRARSVTGTFSSRDVASFVAFLGGMREVRVTDDGAGGYVITSQ